MKTKGILLALVAASFIYSCKKKDSPEPEPTPTPTTPTPVSNDITFAQSVGASGTALTDFNFSNSGSDMSWGMATDGNFVYVADFGNSCVKKVDLSTNTILGWYGFKAGVWGYHTDNVAAGTNFKPTRVIYKNNNLYVFSRVEGWGKSKLFKFNVAASAIDSSRTIPVYSFFSADVDQNENVVVVATDSIKVYSPGSSVTRFGGFGSADGKLDNSGYLVQVQAVGDTIVVIDAGNDRIQKFNTNGTFISKFAINTYKDYTNLIAANNKYYFLQQSKFAEFTAGGTLVKEYSFKANPSGFSPSQKQFVIAGNKVVFQDNFTHKLHIYTR